MRYEQQGQSLRGYIELIHHTEVSYNGGVWVKAKIQKTANIKGQAEKDSSIGSEEVLVDLASQHYPLFRKEANNND